MLFDLDRIGAGLPVAASLPELSHTLGNQTASRTTAVIQAPPGTGKTTLIPPALHNHTKGKILVTAPRRVAVRAAARRLRHLDPQRARSVGFAVRGEYQRGDAVEFVTPGVLLRRLLTDPGLEGISGVIKKISESVGGLIQDGGAWLLSQFGQTTTPLSRFARQKSLEAEPVSG